MKKVLVITYYWPPSGGPGVQRVLKFCKYLPQFNWEPIILTVKNGDYSVNDLSLIPEFHDFDIYKAKSLSLHKIYNFLAGKSTTPAYQLSSSNSDNVFERFSRWLRYNLVIPDGRIGWYPKAVKLGSDIIDKNKISVIFSSAPPYTTHLIAKSLSCKFNLPWVADFRDPWSDYHYYENNRIWITRKIDEFLEKRVIDNANSLITVSETLSANFKKPTSVIYNGYDESDYISIEKKENKNIIISYFGTMSNRQKPSKFFDSVHELNKGKQKYQIDLVGSVHPEIMDEIQNKNYSYFIDLVPYLPHRDAITKMCQSDYLLLVIANSRKNMGLVSAKIFEYIRSGTNIILIGPPGGDAEKIIRETNSGFCFDYNDKEEFKSLLKGNNKKTPKNYFKYNRENLTSQLAKIFNKIDE